MIPRLMILLLLVPFSVASAAERRPVLKGGETIVFFGDSITQAGGYVNYFEAYLLTRFPGKKFRVINHGISSETISGTSEEDHHPRRPWALPRFARDVAKWKPDVVVACFGMNDGNYYPFEETRFKAYQKGIRTLIERTKNEAKAKLILMTPPPYDPYRRRVGDPNAKTYGYKFPAVDYDETLRRYSEWLVSLRKDGQIVVDLHSQMNALLKMRRKKQVSYSFSPDGVHPDATGHWLMAQFLLEELGMPATAARVKVDAEKRKADSSAIGDLRQKNGGLSFTWTSPLPMPMDPAWDAATIRLAHSVPHCNVYRLAVTGLDNREYALSVDGKTVRKATAREFAAGLRLPGSDELPTVKAALNLLQLVKQRRALNYRLWRTQIDKPLGRKLDARQITAHKARIATLAEQIAELRKPIAMKIAIRPAGR